MVSLFAKVTLLAEQAVNAAEGQTQNGPSQGQQMIWIVGLLAVMGYFVLFRPERQKAQTHKKMIEGLKKNDHVVTFGGIKGIVNNVHREVDEVTLTIDESTGTKLRVTLSSIAQIEGEPTDKEKKK